MFDDSIIKTPIFFVEKMREAFAAFAVQKLLTFFQQKILAYLNINVRIINISLTNDVASFEQPGPGSVYIHLNF